MKNFSEKLKDILYGSIDYVIMLSIIAAVVLIIGWRLDILFQKDVVASVAGNGTKVEEPKKDRENEERSESLEDKKHNETSEYEISEDEKIVENNSKKEDIGTVKTEKDVKNIQIKIPQGSFPAQIASILESNGLIESSTDFIKKAVDLQLDTKLKSGVFSISENASLEEIVKIIAK